MRVAKTRNKVHSGDPFIPASTSPSRKPVPPGLDGNIYPRMGEKKTNGFWISFRHSIDKSSCSAVVLLVDVQSWMREQELKMMISKTR